MSDNQLSYAGRAPYIRETGNGPLGADSEPKWMVAMLRMVAEQLMPDAERDISAGAIDKYRAGQLMQRRLNLIAAAEFIETQSSLLAPQEKISGLIADVLAWAESRCPCVDGKPDPCTLCGARAEHDHCMAADATFPGVLLARIRGR